MKKKEKILIALSGGVDSSVAALLLVRAGYDVTGAFMVNYEDGSNCWSKDYYDAVRVAAQIGIPIIKLDFTKEYTKHVLDYMYKEYRAGRTPNPDVLCNKFVKFGVWLDKAKRMAFDKLATGHYARLQQSDFRLRPDPEVRSQKSEVHLLIPKDRNKDQTYFLHQLTQKQLANVLFPLGNYTKPQVRAIAKKHHLAVADKKESMGICFVGEVPMKEFLKTKIKTKIGKNDTTDGKVVGKHEGLAFYTIGQRHIGMQNAKFRMQNENTKPLYVVGKTIKKNELIVGYEDNPRLYQKEVKVANMHWISGPDFALRATPGKRNRTSGQNFIFPLECEVRLRHRQKMQNAEFRMQNSRRGILTFKKPQRAVTPGQFAVIYKEGECLGGGVII